MKKQALIFTLVLSVVFSLFSGPASAAEPDSDAHEARLSAAKYPLAEHSAQLQRNAAYVTREMAYAWIQAREDEAYAENYDGVSGVQCVDLIKYYTQGLFGEDLGGGDAYAYAYKDLPDGWYYGSSPYPLDIAVWDKNVGFADKYGHVALVKAVEGDRFYYVDINGNTGKGGSGYCSIEEPTTFIHPYFSPVASGTCGDTVQWEITEDVFTFVQTLTISGTGRMYDYDQNSNQSPWYPYRDSIKTIQIQNGVTDIGNCAFSNLGSFYGLQLPDTLITIGDYAFSNCGSLGSVEIPNGVKSIGYDAFALCGSLIHVGLPESVETIDGGAFYLCKNLTDITMPTSASYMGDWVFDYCESLSSIAIPDGVPKIDNGAFNYCVNLSYVSIPQSVTRIKHAAFNCCDKLTDIYYAGSQEQWEAIEIEALYNDCLTDGSVKIHYNSTGPTYRVSGMLSNGLLWYLTVKYVLVISGNGAMEDYANENGTRAAAASPPWAEYADVIEQVAISNGVTAIGSNAFSGCSAMTRVRIPASLTKVGSSAFQNCNSLAWVSYAGTENQWETIRINEGNEQLLAAELDCAASEPALVASGTCGEHLTWMVDTTGTLTISGTGNMYNYTTDGTPWAKGGYCPYITSAVLTNGVTSVGNYAFYGCSELRRLSLPEGIETLGYRILYGNTGVKELTVPGSVTEMRHSNTYYYGTFEGSRLERVVIEDGVTAIGPQAFINCKSLREITIPEGVTSLGYLAFCGCSALEHITLPDSITSIGYRAFENTALQELTLPAQITSIGSRVLNGNTGVKSLFIPKSLKNVTTEEYSSYYGVLGGSAVETVEFENGIEIIPGGILENAATVTDVILPASVRTIGNDAFMNSGLTSLTLPEGVEVLGWRMLSGNTGVKELTIPGSVTEMRHSNTYDYGTFGGSGLERVVIEDGVTAIGPQAFINCKSLTEITIPEGVTSIGYLAFCGCSSLEHITLPDSIMSISYRAFENTALQELTLPPQITSIGSRVLSGNTEVKSLFIPKSLKNVTTEEYSSYYGVLRGSAVETVEFESGIESIPEGILENAATVTDVILPASVKSIGKGAFSACTSLSDVYYRGTEMEWEDIKIGDNNEPLTEATIHFNSDGSAVTIKEACAVLDGTLAIRFTFTVPENFSPDGAYVEFRGSGRTLRVPFAQAAAVIGSDYSFDYRLAAKEYRDTVTVRLYDGSGEQITLIGKSGTDYTEDGLQYSLHTYVTKMKVRTDLSAEMLALAEGIDAYCTAAQLYFGYNTDGLSVSEAVSRVDAAALDGYAGVFTGALPAGITDRAIQLELVSDTMLRLILYSDSSVPTNRYSFTVNGVSVYPVRNTDGSYYLDVPGISAADLDTAQSFSVSYAGVTYTVQASAMSYARASVRNGDEVRQDLGRALYLYNSAANAYFGY